jgi:hypothetical protein
MNYVDGLFQQRSILERHRRASGRRTEAEDAGVPRFTESRTSTTGHHPRLACQKIDTTKAIPAALISTRSEDFPFSCGIPHKWQRTCIPWSIRRRAGGKKHSSRNLDEARSVNMNDGWTRCIHLSTITFCRKSLTSDISPPRGALCSSRPRPSPFLP